MSGIEYYKTHKYFVILAEPASPEICNGSKGSPTDKPEPSTNNGKERIMCPVCRTIVVRRVYRRHQSWKQGRGALGGSGQIQQHL